MPRSLCRIGSQVLCGLVGMLAIKIRLIQDVPREEGLKKGLMQ